MKIVTNENIRKERMCYKIESISKIGDDYIYDTKNNFDRSTIEMYKKEGKLYEMLKKYDSVISTCYQNDNKHIIILEDCYNYLEDYAYNLNYAYLAEFEMNFYDRNIAIIINDNTIFDSYKFEYIQDTIKKMYHNIRINQLTHRELRYKVDSFMYFVHKRCFGKRKDEYSFYGNYIDPKIVKNDINQISVCEDSISAHKIDDMKLSYDYFVLNSARHLLDNKYHILYDNDYIINMDYDNLNRFNIQFISNRLEFIDLYNSMISWFNYFEIKTKDNVFSVSFKCKNNDDEKEYLNEFLDFLLENLK